MRSKVIYRNVKSRLDNNENTLVPGDREDIVTYWSTQVVHFQLYILLNFRRYLVLEIEMLALPLVVAEEIDIQLEAVEVPNNFGKMHQMFVRQS